MTHFRGVPYDLTARLKLFFFLIAWYILDFLWKRWRLQIKWRIEIVRKLRQEIRTAIR